MRIAVHHRTPASSRAVALRPHAAERPRSAQRGSQSRERRSSSPAPPGTSAAGSSLVCSAAATRCAAWSATRRASQGRAWLERVSVAAGDVLAPRRSAPALDGVDVGLLSRPQHARRKRLPRARPARRRRRSPPPPRSAGVGRLVYLGGLGDPARRPVRTPALTPGDRRGPARRRRAGHASCGPPSSWASGQPLVRDDPLSDRALPAMICPKWVFTASSRSRSTTCSTTRRRRSSAESAGRRVVEIGGADVAPTAR